MSDNVPDSYKTERFECQKEGTTGRKVFAKPKFASFMKTKLVNLNDWQNVKCYS